MFGNIFDFVASIHTVILCRLHRIFWALAYNLYLYIDDIKKGITDLIKISYPFVFEL